MMAFRMSGQTACRLGVAVAMCASMASGGCAPLASGGSSGMHVIPAGAAVVPATPERSSFTVPLVAADGGSEHGADKTPGSAMISVRRDNVLVYAIQIDNAAGRTFTQAQVLRLDGDKAVEVIATLFSDVMLRGRRISVRGTASLSRLLPPDALLAHVREHPGEYRVVVRGERHPVGSLTGSLGSR